MPDLPASLKTALASSATGYGVVCDGVLDIRTVTAERNHAALNALYIAGFQLRGDPCRKPGCECLVQALAQVRPGWRVVAVTVTAFQEGAA